MSCMGHYFSADTDLFKVSAGSDTVRDTVAFCSVSYGDKLGRAGRLATVKAGTAAWTRRVRELTGGSVDYGATVELGTYVTVAGEWLSRVVVRAHTDSGCVRFEGYVYHETPAIGETVKVLTADGMSLPDALRAAPLLVAA